MLQETIVIKIPPNMVLSPATISSLLIQQGNIENEQSVQFDFDKCKWFDGHLTSLLGVLAAYNHQFGRSVSVTKGSENVNKILGMNGFYDSHNITHTQADYFGTAIQYKRINSEEFKAIDEYVSENVAKKVYNLNNDEEDNSEIEMILEAFYELLHNVIDHSKSTKVYLCGQHYFKKKELHISFADMGVTIPYNIEKIESDLESDSDKIEWATKMGNTTKDGISGGLGLHTIEKNLEGLGMLTIISRKGYWEVDSNGDLTKYELLSEFPGTFVNIRLYLEGNNKRIKAKRVLDNPDIFSF